MYRDIAKTLGEAEAIEDSEKAGRGRRWLMYILTFPKNSSIEEQQAAVQGIHDENLLFLIDESPGVPDYIFEPIESTLTEANNVVFSIFNPNNNRLTMEDKIRDIFENLEEAISYEDWNKVEEVRKELLFILDELESDFPSNFDEDY